MPASTKLDMYPSGMFDLVENFVERAKALAPNNPEDIPLVYPDAATANKEKLQIYGFLRALRSNNHSLGRYSRNIKIRHPNGSNTLTMFWWDPDKDDFYGKVAQQIATGEKK